MKSRRRKRSKRKNTKVAALQRVPVSTQLESPGRSFEQTLRQCSSQVRRRISWLRSYPWLNRIRAMAPKRITVRPLASAWAWFRRNYATPSTKRMRVAEMVSLGEKRFVALLSVDGREFLIGGGTSGIALLTPIKKTRRPKKPVKPPNAAAGQSTAVDESTVADESAVADESTAVDESAAADEPEIREVSR